MAIATIRRPQVDAVPAEARRAVTAVLAVLLTAATGAAVLNGGWTDGEGVAVLIGVLGAGSAAVLRLLRPRPSVRTLLAPVLLAACLVLPTIGTAPLPEHANGTTIFTTYVVAAFTGIGGNDAWAFNVGLGALLWACGAWAVEISLASRRGALATAPCWAVLAVNVINSPSPATAALWSFVAAGFALLLIAAVQLERLGAAWQRRGVVMLPGTTSRFAVAVAVAAVLTLLAGVLPALTSTDVSGRLFSSGGPGSGSGRTGGGSGTGAAVTYSRSTIPGGALAEVGTQQLTYTTSEPRGAYLQMAVDSVFASGAWLPYADGPGGFGLAVEASPPGVIVRDRLPADGGVGRDTRVVSADIRVANDASGNNTVPFPGEPESSSIEIQLAGVTGGVQSNGIVSVDSATAADAITGHTFTTAGTVSTASADQLRAAGTTYPDFIRDSGFLVLPDDGQGQVAAIRAAAARWTAQASTPYDRAVAIESHLRDPTLFTYTLSPPLSRDPATWNVVYFLTTSHAGYCQYFASAMGAMLRAVGVPSRLVNGYGPGSLVPSPSGNAPGTSTRQVTSNDAHTWVEAYFPQYGWIPFEPTPPSVQGNYQPFSRGGAATATAAPSSATPKGGGGHGAGPGDTSSGGDAAIAHRGSPPIAQGAGIGLVLLALLVAAWALLPRSTAGVWRRLLLASRLAGVGRDPSATYREAAARFGAALAGAGTPASARLVTLVTDIGATSDRLSYGPSPPGRDEVAALVRSWRSLARGLPRAVLAGLLRRRSAP